MAYIGREPQVGNFQVCDAISVVNGQAAYTMQVNSVNVSPETANHMLVSLNGVLQAPGSSYTVSGSTITFASNLVTGDVINFIHILGSVLDLGVPSDSTVSLAKLTATGTKNSTTFLRGDNTFAAAGGGMYELIQTQTISSAVAQVDFTSTQLTTTYVDYLIVITGAKLANDGASLRLRVSTDGGSSFDSSSNYVFATQGRGSDGSSRTSNGNADSKINLHTGDMGSATGRNFSGFVECFDPLNQTSNDKFFIGTYRMANWDSNGYLLTNFGGFSFDDSGSEDTVFNGLRFLTSSGNISQGVFSIYGRKTS